MKTFDDTIQVGLKQLIKKFKEKGGGLPKIMALNSSLEMVLEKYTKYFPLTDLLKEVEIMVKDPHFKTPASIEEKGDGKTPSEIWRQFQLLLWDDNILKRFSLFALIKALSEVINFRYRSDEGPNKIYDLYVLINYLSVLANAGANNFASVTFNSKDQSINKSFSMKGQTGILLESFQEQIDEHQNGLKNKTFLDWEKEQIVEFEKYILKMDIEIMEKDIFIGALNDFEVTKMKNGKESERYKILMLANLFKHTHPHLYHTQGSSDGKRTQDDLNYESFSKFLSSEGSGFFE